VKRLPSAGNTLRGHEIFLHGGAIVQRGAWGYFV
jgi:hypothetical protein